MSCSLRSMMNVGKLESEAIPPRRGLYEIILVWRFSGVSRPMGLFLFHSTILTQLVAARMKKLQTKSRRQVSVPRGCSRNSMFRLSDASIFLPPVDKQLY